MLGLRAATEADIPAIVTIVQSAFWSNFHWLEPGSLEDEDYREIVRQRHEREARDFWPDITLAEFDGKPGGWGARFRGRNEISEMWVHAEFQGMGAGAALIRKFLKDIAGEGHQDAWIETHGHNQGGIRLYRRTGFAIDHEKLHFSKGLNRYLPIVRMRQSLS